MKLNRTVIQKANIFVYLIFICYSIFAQTEEVSKLKSHEIFAPQKLNLQPFSTDLHLKYSYDRTFQNYFAPTNMIFRLKENTLFTSSTFTQNKIEDYSPGLRHYETFNHCFNYRINDKTKIDIGIDLARQHCILYADNPNYQIGFQASVEIAITKKHDAFIYGQYFTSPINKSKDFF